MYVNTDSSIAFFITRSVNKAMRLVSNSGLFTL